MQKILYVDMDNVLTDFPAALARQPREILEIDVLVAVNQTVSEGIAG